ncbi:hypothetical protein KSS87_021303 [Heliosperma pusillum]|nr:hypothetical protein KSS87_021303 [Heliosperma pusillum]
MSSNSYINMCDLGRFRFSFSGLHTKTQQYLFSKYISPL